jgi:tetratricopeptide (TPR) repeat protein
MSEADLPQKNEPARQVNTGSGAYIEGKTEISGGTNVFGGNVIIPSAKRYRCPKYEQPPEYFAGRDTELTELRAKLKGNELLAITALNGLGGIGKTTLARKLAFDLCHEAGSEQVFRAVLWLELAQQPDEGRLLERLAKQVETDFARLPDEDLSNLADRVQATLQEAIEGQCPHCGLDRILFVLDDVWESGIEIAKRLKAIKPANTTVLITSRFESVAARLGVNPRNKQMVSKLEPQAGASLLAEYLPDAPRSDLEELSKALRGYTLALTLAAKRLLNEPSGLAELDNHLQQYQNKMPAGTGFNELELDMGQEKDESLTVSLHYSYTALNEAEQAHFRALGVLAYDERFDLPILAALWQVSEDTAKNHAKRLWQLGLLEVAKGRFGEGVFGRGIMGDALYGQGWYLMHPVLQSYALALLKEKPEEYHTAHRRYVEHIIGLASQFNELPPEQWNQLTMHLPHIHVVGNRLVEQTTPDDTPEESFTLALRFANNICRYLEMRREVGQVEWLEMGLKVASYWNDQDKAALFFNGLGLYYDDLGEKAKALDYYEQALSLRRAMADHRGESETLTNIGGVYYALGEQTKALIYYEQALPLRRAVGDPVGEAYTLHNIGWVYAAIEEHAKALTYYEQALPLQRTGSDWNGVAYTLTSIGNVYAGLGEYTKALDYYDQALPLRRSVGNRRGEAYTLHNIGAVYATLGDQIKALDYYEQALSLSRIVGDHFEEAEIFYDMSLIYWYKQGEREKGLALLEQSEALHRALQRPNLPIVSQLRAAWQAELEQEKQGEG